MINEITPEEYADTVARLCRYNFSIRALTLGGTIPVTQMVICNTDTPLCNAADLGSVGEFDLIFRRMYTDRANHYYYPTNRVEFKVHVSDGPRLYDAIRDAVLAEANKVWPTMTDDNIAEMAINIPVFMFMTTLNCGDADNLDKVRSAYIRRLHDKYNLIVPKSLIRIRRDDFADVALAHKIRFEQYDKRGRIAHIPMSTYSFKIRKDDGGLSND